MLVKFLGCIGCNNYLIYLLFFFFSKATKNKITNLFPNNVITSIVKMASVFFFFSEESVVNKHIVCKCRCCCFSFLFFSFLFFSFFLFFFFSLFFHNYILLLKWWIKSFYLLYWEKKNYPHWYWICGWNLEA